MGLFDNLFKSTPMSPSVPLENISIQRLVPKMKEWKIDTLLISTSSQCVVCKEYNRKIYSFYGWSKKYNKLPDFLKQRKCPECNKYIGATMYMK